MTATSEAGRQAIAAGKAPAEWDLRVQLAAAYRINQHLGWEDSMNTHTSLRLPGPEHNFLINPFGLRFDEIKASNLVKVDLDGQIVGPTDYPVNQAGFVIHSAMHLARADAKCIVHTHTLAGMAVAALKDGLLPIGLFALGFENRLSYHDFEGASGSHNLSERDRLAASLGPTNKAMVLRSHGLLTCGESVAEAVIWMYRLERACQVQVATHGAASELLIPSEAARQSTMLGTLEFMTTYDTEPPGAVEFAAFMRLIDRIDPSYRD